jgi:enoyl-CoA hydratase
MATYSFDAATQVARIALNDGKMNAFGFDMMSSMNAALDSAEADLPEDAGTLLLTSVGARAFSAGFDLDVMGNPDTEPSVRQELLEAGIQLCERLFLFRRPVVLAASGHALALGAILLCCADLRIGNDSPKVKIGLPEIAIGMQLPVFGVKLVEARLSSPSHYTNAVLLGAQYSSAEAVSAGFLDEVVAEEELAAYAAAEAARLSEHCKGGFGATKLHQRQPIVDYIRQSGTAKL